MNNPLAGTRGVWLRQFSDTGERITPKILKTMQDFGITAWWQKCADGVNYQGRIDQATPILSATACATLQTTAKASGVTFCPVVVPRGNTPVAEAGVHASIAKACGLLCVDLEPGEGYFEGSMADFLTYVSTLRKQAPQAYLILQPDGRPANVPAINYDSIHGYFDAVAPQLYIGYDDGWLDVEAEIEHFLWFKNTFTTVIPTLYILNDIASMMYFWNCIYPQVDSLCGFAFGSANAAQLRIFQSLPLATPNMTDRAFIESLKVSVDKLSAAITSYLGES